MQGRGYRAAERQVMLREADGVRMLLDDRNPC